MEYCNVPLKVQLPRAKVGIVNFILVLPTTELTIGIVPTAVNSPL